MEYHFCLWAGVNRGRQRKAENMLTFQVVRSRTRHYGYSIQAPPQITWVIGPGPHIRMVQTQM